MLKRQVLYFVDEVFRDDLPQACVELLPVLVEHHGVGIPVQLLKAQPTVVLPLNLLDGILQKVPDVVDVLFIHCHLKIMRRLNLLQLYLFVTSLGREGCMSLPIVLLHLHFLYLLFCQYYCSLLFKGFFFLQKTQQLMVNIVLTFKSN